MSTYFIRLASQALTLAALVPPVGLTLPQLPLRDSCELGLLKPRYKTHDPAASHIKQAIPDCRPVQLLVILWLG